MCISDDIRTLLVPKDRSVSDLHFVSNKDVLKIQTCVTILTKVFSVDLRFK